LALVKSAPVLADPLVLIVSRDFQRVPEPELNPVQSKPALVGLFIDQVKIALCPTGTAVGVAVMEIAQLSMGDTKFPPGDAICAAAPRPVSTLIELTRLKDDQKKATVTIITTIIPKPTTTDWELILGIFFNIVFVFALRR